ncbi:MAG: tRNA (N6-isopentenyl adenosine(37)-C2)-methylthiotransferase MiaB [Actinomycetota bacterium]|nr:tRNA (N6-isopentenyl adenosine(37)-C2)-methylthiotransferase MiaB [Actinomycetota bacterium]
MKSYFVKTYGCQMNVHDSEHIRGVMEEAGFLLGGSPADAQVIIYNTCAVRKSAEDKVWGSLGSLSSRKKDGQTVVVTGCMARKYGIEFLRKGKTVDAILGIESISRIPELASMRISTPFCELVSTWDSSIESLPTKRTISTKALVPVSLGCSKECAYCIVPIVRGPERSRKPGDILREVLSLASSGVVEVVLLGQNVNSYGHDFSGGINFAKLLRKVADVPGIKRVRFETSHPSDLSIDIVDSIAEIDEVCKHVHLPLQSGSNKILSLMGRGYSKEEYEDIAQEIRKKIPGVTLTTDIIVGFPGETEKDFSETIDVLGRVGFENAYLFKYSPREGTRASRMFVDDVSEQEKQHRLEILNIVQERQTMRALESLVGSTLEVLIENRARKGEYFLGRAPGNQVVLVGADGLREGMLVSVRIVKAGKHSLRGVAEKVVGRSC